MMCRTLQPGEMHFRNSFYNTLQTAFISQRTTELVTISAPTQQHFCFMFSNISLHCILLSMNENFCIILIILLKSFRLPLQEYIQQKTFQMSKVICNCNIWWFQIILSYQQTYISCDQNHSLLTVFLSIFIFTVCRYASHQPINKFPEWKSVILMIHHVPNLSSLLTDVYFVEGTDWFQT